MLNLDLTISPMHTTIWIVSFIGILISLFFLWKYDTKRGYIIGPLTYFLNVFLFNLVLHVVVIFNLHILTFQQLEIWSGAVRLHSLFLLIGFIIFQPIREKKHGRIDT